MAWVFAVRFGHSPRSFPEVQPRLHNESYPESPFVVFFEIAVYLPQKTLKYALYARSFALQISCRMSSGQYVSRNPSDSGFLLNSCCA